MGWYIDFSLCYLEQVWQNQSKKNILTRRYINCNVHSRSSKPYLSCFYSCCFFSVRLLSILRGHSVFSSLPQRPMTSYFEGFLYQILSITLFSYSWERASISLFQCWMLNKGTTGTIFITCLVWRGPWLGIEPGTSHTRSKHSTTRLSRRRSFTGDWTRDLPHSKPALYH